MRRFGTRQDRTHTYSRWLQVRNGLERSPKKKRHQGNHQHPKSVAQRTQEEPLPYQGRKNHASHYHQDDADAGVDVVRQREKTIEKRKQNDVGAEE